MMVDVYDATEHPPGYVGLGLAESQLLKSKRSKWKNCPAEKRRVFPNHCRKSLEKNTRQMEKKKHKKARNTDLS